MLFYWTCSIRMWRRGTSTGNWWRGHWTRFWWYWCGRLYDVENYRSVSREFHMYLENYSSSEFICVIFLIFHVKIYKISVVCRSSLKWLFVNTEIFFIYFRYVRDTCKVYKKILIIITGMWYKRLWRRLLISLSFWKKWLLTSNHKTCTVRKLMTVLRLHCRTLTPWTSMIGWVFFVNTKNVSNFWKKKKNKVKR